MVEMIPERRLWSALQPIVALDSGYVVAHEALLRGPAGTDWESPAALFAAADRMGSRLVLEANARRMALRRLPDLPENQKLFINIDALSPEIPAMPGYSAIDPKRVTLKYRNGSRFWTILYFCSKFACGARRATPLHSTIMVQDTWE